MLGNHFLSLYANFPIFPSVYMHAINLSILIQSYYLLPKVVYFNKIMWNWLIYVFSNPIIHTFLENTYISISLHLRIGNSFLVVNFDEVSNWHSSKPQIILACSYFNVIKCNHFILWSWIPLIYKLLCIIVKQFDTLRQKIYNKINKIIILSTNNFPAQNVLRSKALIFLNFWSQIFSFVKR